MILGKVCGGHIGELVRNQRIMLEITEICSNENNSNLVRPSILLPPSINQSLKIIYC